MKRRKLLGVFLTFVMALGLAASAYAYTAVTMTGVTYYDPARAYNCYTLIDGAMLTLIDMNGNIVHDWRPSLQQKYRFGAERMELQPNGHIVVMKPTNRSQPGIPDLFEFDWDGNEVWTYEASSPREKPHHYLTRLENGNTLCLVQRFFTPAEAEDFPGNEWYPRMRRSGLQFFTDTIVEITPANEIVWSWSPVEDPFFDVNRFSVIDPIADWTHGNTCSVLPDNKWYDAGDLRFKPGNILYNPRNYDEFVLIDKDTRLVIWSYQSDFQGGFGHPHEPEMIPKGIPGEGNIICFDNGLFVRHRDHNGRSYILEINPIDKEIVWMYGSANFFSSVGSTQTRLPNGNTFIAETVQGRCFQVTPTGDIVWEYNALGSIARPRPYSYDFCPQFKDLPKPEVAVPLPSGARPLPRMSVGAIAG